MKLLIIKLSSLGDVVQTLPSLTLLKRYFPSSQFDWIVDERNAEILKDHPYINKLIIFSNDTLFSFQNFFRFLKNLRSEKYDGVIDYQDFLKVVLLQDWQKQNIK